MRRVRVALLIAEAMVLAMYRDPGDRRAFSGQGSQQAEQAADPRKRLKTAVGQEAVVAQADSQAAADPGKNAKRQQADPREAERRGQGPHVQHDEPADHRPIEPVGPDANHLALGGDVFARLRPRRPVSACLAVFPHRRRICRRDSSSTSSSPHPITVVFHVVENFRHEPSLPLSARG